MDIAMLHGPGLKLPNQHDYLPRLKWRRRLRSREILQLLHVSRQLTLSVSHPGSVNLDAGALTSMGHDLVPAAGD
jgi:hypothetical protein